VGPAVFKGKQTRPSSWQWMESKNYWATIKLKITKLALLFLF